MLVLAGTMLFSARLPGAGKPHPAAGEHRGLLGALSDPAIRMVALSTVPIGFCLGAVEVSIPAFSEDYASAALAGVLLAIWSAASGVGGLLYGVWGARGAPFESFLATSARVPARLPAVARGLVAGDDGPAGGDRRGADRAPDRESQPARRLACAHAAPAPSRSPG